MTTSPWGPQDGSQPASSVPLHPGAPFGGGPGSPGGPPVQPGAFGPPPGRPSGKPWGLLAAFTGLVIVAVAATAGITYAIARTDSWGQAAAGSTSSPPTETATPALGDDISAAKAQLCQGFDANTRGKNSQGPIVSDGALNVPVALRAMNSVAVLQNSLTSKVPADVASAARSFIDSELKLITGATANAPIDELVRLNDRANAASDRLSDACGLPH